MNRVIPVEVLDLSKEPTLKRLASGLAPSDTVYLFSSEWELRRKQCEAFLRARSGVFERRLAARSCVVEEVRKDQARSFLDENHIQGTNNLSLVYFGLFRGTELLGVLSLGRHSRQIAQNRVVLDRLCFRAGVQAVGGVSKLFRYAANWAVERRYDEIISFSDNRLTTGKLYEVLGFRLDAVHRPDYFYVKDGEVYSKQSQKKSSVDCPSAMTELEWATARGLTRVYDAGKKRWLYNLRPGEHQTRSEKCSEKCAKQHQSGAFKHAHLRGFFSSQKNNAQVYYGSSYELRCLYLMECDPAVRAFRRCDSFKGAEGWRNPDFWVEFADGRTEVWEVKPQVLLQRPEVQAQLAESMQFAVARGAAFRTWTEVNSGLSGDHHIIRWAKDFIAASGRDVAFLERRKAQRAVVRARYYQRVAADKVLVWCDYCQLEHTALRSTYTRNIARNGRYVCERLGGHLAGKKPKPKKTNPYADAGKKVCSRCGEIKTTDSFDVRRASWDGLTAACKTCVSLKNKTEGS